MADNPPRRPGAGGGPRRGAGQGPRRGPGGPGKPAQARPAGGGGPRQPRPGGLPGSGARKTPGGPAGDGGPRRPRQAVSPALGDPFGPAGPKPQFGKLQRWQLVLLGCCGAMIAALLFLVFFTNLIRLPGIDEGVLIRHNVDFLAETITLPKRPVSAIWQMLPHDVDASSAGGGTAWRITAVLEFTPDDTAAILATARATPDVPAIGALRWFPEPVREALAKTPATLYDAEPFFSSLYRRGALAHIEGTNYFLLQLTSD